MEKYFAVILLSAMVLGCRSYPITRDIRNHAQELTITQAAANPQTTRGTIVIWGGRVMRTINNTNGGEIYVLQLPLNRRGRPASDDTLSGGRFIATSREFLDPAAYPRGRLITVAGALNGVRNERLQNIFYLYPVLIIKQIHPWANRTGNNNFNYGPYPDWWYWTYYNPSWWDGGMGWYYPDGVDSRSAGGHN